MHKHRAAQQVLDQVSPVFWPKMGLYRQIVSDNSMAPSWFFHKSLGWSLLCLMIWVQPFWAAEPPVAEPDFISLSLEDLGAIKVPTVFGASKHEQKTTEAPSAVSVVTQEDIKHFGYRTLGDLLRSVRGFYVTSDRIYNYTGLRGVNRPGDFGGRVLINIDGHRMNEPIYDSAFTSTDFLLDMDLVDRVEVIRGPGSSLYGNNAFFTVINVVTRRGRDVHGFEASATAGSLDTHSGRITYGNKFSNEVELLVSGTYLDSLGHDPFRFEEFSSVADGIARNLDNTSARSAFASIGYGDLQLVGGYIDRRKKNPTGQYGSEFNDPRALNEDERAFGELKYGHVFEGDWSVQARIYQDHYRYDATFAFDNNGPLPGPLTVNRDVIKADWVGGEASVSKTLWDRHRLTLGGELRDDFDLRVSNFDVDPAASYVSAMRSTLSYAFYSQAEISLLTNLTLNAGVRYDHFSLFGGTVNPRGAINYQPWREGTFKFIYGQAFRAPNLYETDYIQPSYKSNPNLGTETIRSYEWVYEQGIPGGLRAGGSLFLNQIKGLIGQLTDPNDNLNYFDNLDRVDVRGFEAELEGRWARGMRARLSYTLTEAKATASGRSLDNSPKHLGKFNLVAPLYAEKVFLGLELQTMSRRTTVGGGSVGPIWLANLTLFSRELVKHLELSASLYNVFDRRYRDPVSSDFSPIDAIQQDGRTARIKLTFSF